MTLANFWDKDPIHKALLEASVVCVIQRTGELMYANENYTSLSGFRVADKQAFLNEQTHSPVILKAIWSSLEQHNRWQGELMNHHKNGQPYWVDITISTLENHAAAPQFLCILKDVTEAKQSQIALLEQKLLFDRLSQNVPGIIYNFYLTEGEDPVFPFVSHGSAELLNISAAELMKAPQLFFEVVHPDDLQPLINSIKTAFHSNASWAFQFRVIVGAKTKWISGESNPYLERNGKFHWYGFMHDITAEKEAQLKLSESEWKNRLMVERSRDGILFTDATGQVLSVNAEACRIFDLSEQALCSFSIQDLTQLGTFVPQVHAAAIEIVDAMQGTLTLSRNNGSHLTCELTTTTFLDINGVLKNTVILRDTTESNERIAAQKRLAEQEELIRSTADNLPKGLIYKYITNAEGHLSDVLFVSSGVSSLYGVSAEEARRNPEAIFQMIDASMISDVIKAIKCSRENLTDFDYEYKIRDQSGESKWVHTRAKVKRLPDGSTEWYGVTLDISLRKKAQEQSALLNERLSAILEGTEAGTWEWNIETGETVFNEKWANFLGYTLSEISPIDINTWVKFAHPDDLERSGKLLEKHFSGELPYYECQARMKHRDGHWIWVLDRGKVHKWSEDGKPLIMSGTHIDISRQKDIELQLIESKLRLQALFDHAINGIVLFNDEGEYIEMNPSAKRILGYDENEFQCHDNYVSRTDDSTRRILARHFLGQNLDRADVTFFKPDGELAIVHYNGAKNILDGLHLIILEDITEKQKIEERLEFTRFTIEQSADLMMWMNRDGNLTDFNPAFARALGYTPEELRDVNIASLDKHYNFLNWKRDWDTLRERRSIMIPTRLTRKDGHEIEVEIYANFVEFKGQEYNCAFIQDITERKKTELALLASNKEKDLLIKEIHHRVKNNLQLISSLLYLKLSGITDSEMICFLEGTRQKIRSIALIHERLLQTNSVGIIDISDYLQALIQDLKKTTTRHGLELEFRSRLEPEEVTLDTAIYCGLIVNELVTNAVKHAFPGRSKGIIEINYIRNGNKRELITSDNGVTLPEEIAPGMNGSFGMQMLNVFARQLHGTLHIERSKGTRFRIVF